MEQKWSQTVKCEVAKAKGENKVYYMSAIGHRIIRENYTGNIKKETELTVL